MEECTGRCAVYNTGVNAATMTPAVAWFPGKRERGNGIGFLSRPKPPVISEERFSSERYDMYPYMSSPLGFIDLVAGDFSERIRSLPVERTYIVEDYYRPDLVSWRNYGTTKLWWMILIYNGLSISDLVPGVKVYLFGIGDLESLLYDMYQETVLGRTQ